MLVLFAFIFDEHFEQQITSESTNQLLNFYSLPDTANCEANMAANIMKMLDFLVHAIMKIGTLWHLEIWPLKATPEEVKMEEMQNKVKSMVQIERIFGLGDMSISIFLISGI